MLLYTPPFSAQFQSASVIYNPENIRILIYSSQTAGFFSHTPTEFALFVGAESEFIIDCAFSRIDRHIVMLIAPISLSLSVHKNIHPIWTRLIRSTDCLRGLYATMVDERSPAHFLIKNILSIVPPFHDSHPIAPRQKPPKGCFLPISHTSRGSAYALHTPTI